MVTESGISECILQHVYFYKTLEEVIQHVSYATSEAIRFVIRGTILAGHAVGLPQ